MEEEKNQIPADIVQMPFERSLEELENVVSRIENGQLSLEELMVSFERGTHLVRHCRKKLDAFEKRIEILNRGEDGSPVWEEFKQN